MPPAAGNFCKFLEKKLFKSHWITFRASSEPFQKTRFLTFQSQLKKFSCSILLLQLNPKTRLDSCIIWCKILIVSDLVYRTHCLLQYLAVNNNPLEDFPWRFLFSHEVYQL